jgi:Helix-turn-helix domain
MSVKVMSLVWEHYPVGGGEFVLALSLADHSNDRGEGIWPSVEYSAKRSRQSVRSVQNYLAEMRSTTWLIPVKYQGGGRGKATEYRINPLWITNPAGFAPFSKTGERVQSTTEKGADYDAKGCTSFAPQPLLTVSETTTTLNSTSNAREPRGVDVVVHESIEHVSFPAFFSAEEQATARALLAKCAIELRQSVVNEVAGIWSKGKLRGSPIGLLHGLIERAAQGRFYPSEAIKYEARIRREAEELARADQVSVEQQRTSSPEAVEASRSLREKVFAEFRSGRINKKVSEQSQKGAVRD